MFCHLTEEEARKAVREYRVYFKEKGIYQNKVYPGVKELLELLQKEGAHLYLATSKPEIFAKKVLQHFELDSYFEGITGSELDGTRGKKEEVISFLLKKYQIPKEKAVLIGDTQFDVIGAKKTGLPCIGVLYGYGTEEELKKAGAERIVTGVAELKEYLKEEKKEAVGIDLPLLDKLDSV